MAVKLITLTPPAVNMVEGSGPCGICLALKERDEPRTSTITRTVDSELIVPLSINERWLGQLTIFYNGATGGDLRMHFEVPSGATGAWNIMGLTAGVTTFTGEMTSIGAPGFGSGNSLAFGAGGSANDDVCFANFVVQNGANAGNLNLFWAQRVSNATPTIIRANSSIVAHRM